MVGIAATACAVVASPSYSADCTLLATHEECSMGDGCKWEEHGIKCMNLDQPHDCLNTVHRDECIHVETCEWSEVAHQCYDKKDGPRCNLSILGEEECSALDGCTWQVNFDLCAKTAGPLKCHAFQHSAKDCNAQEECKFNNALGNCNHNDHVYPCIDWQGEAACTAANGCAWSAEDWTCFDAIADRVCESVFSDEQCVKYEHCEWIKESGVCHRSDLDVACYRLVHEDDCHASKHCVWATQECKDPAAQKPCDWARDDQECLANSDRCEWEPLAEFCKPLGMPVSCERYFNEDACTQTDGCAFSSHGCFDEQYIKPCEEIAGRMDCYKIGCLWNATIKVCEGFADIKTVGTDGPPHNPGQADDANLKIFDSSNAGSAGSSTDGGFAKPDCTEVRCKEVGPQGGACASVDEMWMQSPAECCPRCGYTNKVCQLHSSMETCPDKCTWHEQYVACLSLAEAVPCRLISAEVACVDQKLRPDQCQWHADIYSCVNQGDTPGCDLYQAEELCSEAEHCAWDLDQATCWYRDTPLQCKHYGGKAECESYEECTFDDHLLACVNVNDEIPCSSYSFIEAGCTQESAAARCNWFPQKHACLAKSAKVNCEYRTKFECAAIGGCKWDKQYGQGQCNEVHDFHPMACSEHGAEWLCAEEPGCRWHNAANKCIGEDEVILCNEFHGDWECNNAEGSQACTWDDEAYTCLSPGEVVPCAKWFDGEKCSSQKCVWNEEYFACHDPDAAIPCTSVHDEASCKDREDCKFFFHLCYDSDHKVPCKDYFSEADCAAQPGCKFFPSKLPSGGGGQPPPGRAPGAPGDVTNPFPDMMKGMCGNEDQSVCNFLFDKFECNPRLTNGECAYDTMRHMCRPLRKSRQKDEL